MKPLKLGVILFGAILPLGMTVVLFLTFLAAYFNNNIITININAIGEANIELMVLLCLLPLTFYSTFTILKHYVKSLRRDINVQIKQA